jgi:hypothetical protein
MRSFQFRVSALVCDLERVDEGEPASIEAAEGTDEVHGSSAMSSQKQMTTMQPRTTTLSCQSISGSVT